MTILSLLMKYLVIFHADSCNKYRAHNPHLDITYLTYAIVTTEIVKKCGLCLEKCGLCRKKCGLCREKCGLRDYITHTY